MAERTRVPHFRWSDGVGLITLAAVLLFVAWDGLTRGRQLLQLSDTYGETVDAPDVDPRSPTGYASGRRSILLPGSVTDGHHWIMHTQSMIATGEWRVRSVDYDNVPEGRDMHWASLFRWWLGAVAWIDHILSGRPIGVSVERAALISGPVMFGLMAIGVFFLSYRAVGGVAVALVLASLVAVRPFYLDYLPGRPDHHGLANICVALTIWLLLIGTHAAMSSGSGAPPLKNPARRWFMGSGVAGGVGLWISAATQVPVLIGAGLGFLVAGWVGRRAAQRIGWLADPDLLRRWGWVGGATSLAAYLLEYFPHHLGVRLEVNHPLYALAWVGAGEVLRLFARILREGRRGIHHREWAIGVTGGAAILVVPLLITSVGEAVFMVAQPLMWRISNHHVAEAQSLAQILGDYRSVVTWMALAVPVAWMLLPLLTLGRTRLPREWVALIALGWVPAAVGWILGLGQIRWYGLAWALTIPMSGAAFLLMRIRFGDRRRVVGLGMAVAGLILVPGIIHAVRQVRDSGEPAVEDLHKLAGRDFAHWLRLRTEGEAAVVIATPGATTWLAFSGGVRGVGTLYWENAVGMQKLGEFYAASSAETARALAQRWGVTHIVCTSWNATEAVMVKEVRELPPDAPVPTDAFMIRLLAAPVPEPWLRAVPFALPSNPALTNEHVRVWEVVPEQTPADAVAHATNYFLELGRAEDLKRIVPVLSRFTDSLNAAVMLAAIASRDRDAPAFLAAVDRVLTLRGQADTLAPDDLVPLVVVLAVAQREDLARDHLQRCMWKLTERSVRHLTVGALSDLIALSDLLGVAFSNPELQRLAESLLPPSRRN